MKYDLEEKLAFFKEKGYTIFHNVYDQKTISTWINKHQQLREDTFGEEEGKWWFKNTLELAPKLMLPAVSNPHILDFAERVMGPFVQLDNLTLAGFPSVPKDEAKGKVSGWHRDRWAEMPSGNEYQHPLSINAISYLQDLTDEFGPLRVIPGSHRKVIGITPNQRNSPHRDEEIIYMNEGDVVVTHNGLLHSGTPNTSGKIRYFFSVYYNKTWLKHTDDHTGPAIQQIIKEARMRNDHRTLRLVGVDEHLEKRANSGFIENDEESWMKWLSEDKLAKK